MNSSTDSDFDDKPIARLRRKSKNGSKRKSAAKPDLILSTSSTRIDPSSSTSNKKSRKRIRREVNNGDVVERSSNSKRKSRTRIKQEVSSEDEFERPKRSKTKVSSSKKKKGAKKKIIIKKEETKRKVSGTGGKKRELKKLEKTERLSHAMQAFLWWDAPNPREGCQWTTMEHAGISFPETYEPHGVKMKYDGKEVTLNPIEEEAATFFASMDPEGMHLGNEKAAPIFIKNFFKDFKSLLNKRHGIKDFKKCDFKHIRRHLNEQKIIKKAISDEQRKTNKTERVEAMYRFGYAIVDGHIEKVGNYNMEPPGTFRGRGQHPKMGKLKTRVMPEQVYLNISQCSHVPPCPIPGHAWGELQHDPQVQWLGQWKENINNQNKYMQLAAQSSFKGKSDRSKYNKAALLCGNIHLIRASYKNKLTSNQVDVRQLATAMWVIDRLALRVGGEKDTDEEADTVGCCSLRVEHLHFDPSNEGGENKEIELEFLGKDSMLFKQTIDFGDVMYTENNGMGEQVFKNFKLFCKRKKDSDDVFDSLTPTILNSHLKEIMEGLTAKVFRTYNASKTLQDELLKTEQGRSWNKLAVAEKVVEYNNANREVAILCNHQRTVSKAQETQLGNISDKVKQLKEQKKILKNMLKLINSDKEDKISEKADEKKQSEILSKMIATGKKLKDKAKSNDEKILATKADEEAKQFRRDLADFKFSQAHLFMKTPTVDQVVKKIAVWTQKIVTMEMNLKHKDDNKEVSLGTSKLNYMDPRITVAWCKRNEVPVEKTYSKTQRDKFNWAMAVPPDWEFNAEIAREG